MSSVKVTFFKKPWTNMKKNVIVQHQWGSDMGAHYDMTIPTLRVPWARWFALFEQYQHWPKEQSWIIYKKGGENHEK